MEGGCYELSETTGSIQATVGTSLRVEAKREKIGKKREVKKCRRWRPGAGGKELFMHIPGQWQDLQV